MRKVLLCLFYLAPVVSFAAHAGEAVRLELHELRGKRLKSVEAAKPLFLFISVYNAASGKKMSCGNEVSGELAHLYVASMEGGSSFDLGPAQCHSNLFGTWSMKAVFPQRGRFKVSAEIFKFNGTEGVPLAVEPWIIEVN